MYRVNLTEEQRLELRQLLRDPQCKPRTRDRLEAVRLSDAGWSAPKIAGHLGFVESTVRIWLKSFLADGFAALPDQPHLGQQSSVTPALLAALRTEIDRGDRTWTARQAAAWLAEKHDVSVGRVWMGVLLRRNGFTYKRTQRRLKHKQDPAKVAAKREELERMEKGALAGR